MPTIQVDILEAKQKQDIIEFTARQNDNIITRKVEEGLFDTWEEFANWLINQEADFVRLPNRERNLEITFHTETIIDPEFGEQTIRIVDSVIVT